MSLAEPSVGPSEPSPIAPADDKYSFLNPIYDLAMQLQFDEQRGYRTHHLNCVHVAPKIVPGKLDNLSKHGFDVQRVLDPHSSEQLANRAKIAGRELNAGDLTKPEIEEVLGRVFSPSVHAAINRCFLTEFAVLFFKILVTDSPPEGPESEPKGVSFSWHCDGGPTTHLKMLVYLNPSDEHDGATELLNSATTQMFKKAGYAFCPLGDRLSDLSDLAREFEIPYTPHRARPDAGEAVILEPAGVLHRGVPPTFGTRYMLLIGLIPWAKPWQSFLAENYEIMVKNTNGEFPPLT